MSKKIAIISGSPTTTSRLNALIDIVRQKAASEGINVHEVIVRDLPAEDLIQTRFDSKDIIHAVTAVTQADALVVATPIYKASYTGVLKTFLDMLPQKGLEGKVILPLAVGGTTAHYLAIDYALRPVLSALGATNIIAGVYGLDSQITRLAEGGFQLEEELLTRLQLRAREFLGQIGVQDEHGQFLHHA